MEIDLLAAGIIGFVAGQFIPALKAFIMQTPTKLDDTIWNNMVNEFIAAGVIKPEQMHVLKNMPSGGKG